MRRPPLLPQLAFAVLSAASAASAQDAPPAPPTTPAILTGQVRPGMTVDGLLANIRRVFRELDANGDGSLTAADAELHQAIVLAGLRAQSAAQLFAADLNGDGAVTEAELRAKRRYDQRTMDGAATSNRNDQVEAEIRRMMAADQDNDGRITPAEAAGLATGTPNFAERLSQGHPNTIRELLAFAGKDTASLAPAQVEALAVAYFKSVDGDGNGTISEDELKAAHRLVEERRRRDADAERQRREAAARADCVLPGASEAAKVVLLSAYQAEAVSTTAIGSQEVATGTGTITVEPGAGPLYVVIVPFRPIIWRFTGAVERVERVMIGASMTGPGTSAPVGPPLAGITGIAAAKIGFLPRPACLQYFTDVPSTKASGVAAIVRTETGKEPVLAARYSVAGFTIPSATAQGTPGADRPMLIISKSAGSLKIEGDANVVVEAGAGDLASEMARSFPGGIVEIDPATVVASAKPERYEVLPGQAGLLQLVKAGALARNQSGDYLIKQRTRLPAELGGARFLLLRGVPMPEGNPGQACIISEETGRPLGKSRC